MSWRRAAVATLVVVVAAAACDSTPDDETTVDLEVHVGQAGPEAVTEVCARVGESLDAQADVVQFDESESPVCQISDVLLADLLDDESGSAWQVVGLSVATLLLTAAVVVAYSSRRRSMSAGTISRRAARR